VRQGLCIDKDALERVATIRTEQLHAPEGSDCASCFARVACLGGCHCQYAGQDGFDPANRFDVARGFCESYRAAMTRIVRAALAPDRRLRKETGLFGDATQRVGSDSCIS
jgi:hypothetical protein